MPGNTDMLFDNFFIELLYQRKANTVLKKKKKEISSSKI
jgi:hypothetical protein